MNGIVVALVLMPTSLLLAQAISCLRRVDVRGHMRGFGLLSILLWGLSIVLGILLLSGTLVLSSELGIVMVQGSWAGFGMALGLVGSAVSIGMGLHVCRLQAGRPNHWPWLLGAGVLVGVCAALWLQSLYPGNLPPQRIYAYDLWWPPFLVWLSICLLDIALTAVKVSHPACRLWCAMAVLNSLALLALSQPRLVDSHSEILWRSCLLVLVPISMSLVTWLFLPHFPPLGSFRYRLSRVLIWVPAGIGLLSGVFSLQAWHWETVILTISWSAQTYRTGMGSALPWKTVASIASLLWLCWPVLIGLIVLPQFLRGCHTFKPNWSILPRPTGQQIGFLIASAFLALGLAGLAYFGRLDGAFLLNGAVVVWLLLAEAITGGPLSRLLQRLIDRQQWSDTVLRVSTIGRSIGSRLGSLLSVPSMPVLIGKALVGIIILMVLSELPNAHKTLIQPFKVLGLPEQTEFGKSSSEREEVGQAISEQVVNTLGLLQQELRQEVMLSLQSDSGDEQERKKFELTSVGNSTNVSTALSKGPELEIGGVKIPMSLLFIPVQGPVRWLLGVRAINASVQVEGRGYSLLASSDTGEMWKLAVSPGKISPRSTPISPEASSDTEETRKLAVSPGKISPEVIDQLADELAFHIVKSDVVLAPAMTQSWAAFKPFKEGLEEWRKFETKQNYVALTAAIARFRKATQEDPGFAFAHYRLGLALQKDGQPGVAVKAFRASLRADPSLIPAYIAVASTLYDFERTSYLGEVGSPLDFLFKLPPQSERVANARDLWLEVLRLPGRGDSVANLGSAYYGLCRQANRQGRRLARLNVQQERSHPPEPWSSYYMAYYYCKRAEAQYASLATTQHTNPEVKKGEAYVLQNLGLILANFQRPKKPSGGDQSGWECWATKLEANLNSREGLQYFLRALALLPDDYRIRCYAARAAYAFGDSELLERLQADPAAHLNRANSHRRLARVCASIVRLSPVDYEHLEQTSYRRYIKLCKDKDGLSTSPEHHQLALHEYDEVIRYEPMNIEALTGYADTVWERLIYAGDTKELRGWIEYYAERAVARARQAAAFSSFSPDETMPAIIQATLGKAFLAQGKPKFAIEELEEVVAQAHIPNHPAYHEIHWALAQAYDCAASIDKHLGVGDEDVESRQKRAVKLLGDILQQESTREFQLYSYRPGVLDSPWGKLLCMPNDRMESMPDPPITSPVTLTSTVRRSR
jgi:hypothetical protein